MNTATNDVKPDITIGIDSGTTYSSFSVCLGQATPIHGKFPGEGGQLQSIVFSQNGTLLVGRDARHAAFKEPDRLYPHFKRGLATAPDQPWNCGPTPVELTAYSWRHIWQIARQTFPQIAEHVADLGGTKPRERLRIAVTHPATFRLEQQQALMRAAELVGDGFRIDALFAEPNAGSYWFRDHQAARLKEDDLLAVLDLGGGTFDITVLRYRCGQFDEVIAGRGSANLGGLNFTGAVYEHFCQQLKRPKLAGCFNPTTGFDPAKGKLSDAERRAASAIWDKSEEVKLALATRDQAEAFCETTRGLKELRLTRDEFIQLCAGGSQGNLWQAFEDAVRTVFDGSPHTWRDVAHVILIGGSALLPTLPERTAQVTGRSPQDVHSSSESEWVVSDGAAFYAYAGERTAQVLPGGLGVRMRHGNEHVFKMFFVPGHVIPGTGESVETLGQWVDAPGGPFPLRLELAEGKPGAQPHDSGSLVYLRSEEAVPVHTIESQCDVPVGRHEVRLRFNYGSRKLTYAASFADLPEVEAVCGSVVDGPSTPGAAAAAGTAYALGLLFDCSASMGSDDKLPKAKEAIRVLVDGLDRKDIRACLVQFGCTTRVACSLTAEIGRIAAAADGLTAEGGTPMDEAIRLGKKELDSATDRQRILVIVTDGHPNDALTTTKQATAAKTDGVRVICVGIGRDVSEHYLQYELASSPQDYFFAERARDIPRIFASIVELYIQ